MMWESKNWKFYRIKVDIDSWRDEIEMREERERGREGKRREEKRRGFSKENRFRELFSRFF